MKWSEFRDVVESKLDNTDADLVRIDTGDYSNPGNKEYSFYLEFNNYNLSIEINSTDKVEDLITYNARFDWPECIATSQEGCFDHICPKCNVKFRGYKVRNGCYTCAFAGCHTHKDNGKRHGGDHG